jgi:hypothetical protein
MLLALEKTKAPPLGTGLLFLRRIPGSRHLKEIRFAAVEIQPSSFWHLGQPHGDQRAEYTILALAIQ